jgi:hypothetical protein
MLDREIEMTITLDIGLDLRHLRNLPRLRLTSYVDKSHFPPSQTSPTVCNFSQE